MEKLFIENFKEKLSLSGDNLVVAFANAFAEAQIELFAIEHGIVKIKLGPLNGGPYEIERLDLERDLLALLSRVRNA